MKQLSTRLLACCLAIAAVPILNPKVVLAEPVSPIRTDQSAGDTVLPAPPISSRYAADSAKEVPDFQKHVMPLLGRLGCNGRACHGSFQGRGDFQLSLFGYDFSADHQALMAENTGRVDVDDVDESLILAKPTDADMHEGGKRFEKGQWQYRVLRNWIAAGAAFKQGQTQSLEKLEIQPAEIRFATDADQVSLTVIAHWADGSVEDVTPLCRFSSNDDSIAAIDETGLVRSGDTGDTHVIVYYDNAVAPVPVLQPLSPSKFDAQQSVADTTPTQPIDVLIQQKLDKLGITPSGLCTDAAFVRRAALDITGVLPSTERVEAFLADNATDKREQLINELLESPAYAAWWATRLSDWTGNNAEQLNNVLPVRNVGTKLWFQWLRSRLENNTPYDQIIEGIVTANTRQTDESYLDYCREMTLACNGDLDRFAQRDGMPLFWSRRNFQKPEERAIGFAYTFLGVRIECAQCHKHPFDQWSKQDFDDFSKLFAPIRSGNANQVSPESKETRDELMEKLTGGKKLNGGELRRAIYKAAETGVVVPFGELYVNTRGISDKAKKQRAAAKKKGNKLPPVRVPTGKILGIEQELELSEDPRPALMDWLRDESNPYFAKAIVNRVWSNYFGIGIVDPTDDMNLANPPSNAALLDHLAVEFIRHDFDLKWLHREITLSDAYQRSAATNASNALDRTNFARHIPRRLPAEVVFDMVALATGSTEKANQLRSELDEMAIADGKPRQRNQSNFALDVFGQSIRETNCDCDRSDAPSLLQSIYLRNDFEMYKRIADRDGWVAEACKDLGVAAPNAGQDPKANAKQRAADALRKQLVNRIKQFAKQPAARQDKQREKAEQQFDKATQRIADEFNVPTFASLVADPNSWNELEPVTSNKRRAKNGNADPASDKPGLERIVDQAYLRTLCRYPDDSESEIAMTYINESDSPSDGIEGLMWALVNTKEFIISH
ncbi:DUF1549 and DUF1553 domain-containing protein [Stieleria sp. TO1_6]|uniref:DUF1549 and DUF1553 domain-containing protein n=1 Tax=Stieleria tagensis TaxID=2956795 RepID=UPI00209B4A2E|nr:DUF1549 and DUF1553 domain-containing protein [Stieleria tagensis]MCO8124241.1 DUF1549 and DUF1553 domain-containing protein [Stieleria tagensis]